MTFAAAMIFAAGFGTRMGDLTARTPKPMLPLGGRPMIDHAIDLLRDAGIKTLVANTHYMPVDLEAHLAERGVLALREDPILDTGGGLKAALPYLGEGPVITMNPDALWQGGNPVNELIQAWEPGMTGLLMLTKGRGQQGDFSLDKGEIRRNGTNRYTGLQALRTDRLSEIDARVFSLNLYWDHLLATGKLHGVVYSGEWTDIGTRENLKQANQRLKG